MAGTSLKRKVWTLEVKVVDEIVEGEEFLTYSEVKRAIEEGLDEVDNAGVSVRVSKMIRTQFHGEGKG